MRRDLADLRLAGRVFAPHYAAPLPRRVARPAPLLTDLDDGQAVMLDPGEPFEVLEIAGGKAWGVAPARGLVGYLVADALTAA